MNISLYQIETDEYPDGIADPDAMLLVHSEENPPEDLDVNELNFLTTLGVKSDSPEDVVSHFKNWWGDNVGTSLKVALIASESGQLQEFRKNEIDDIEENTWLLKASFVAYQHKWEDAYSSAVKLIKESELNLQ